jgi:Rps23 Pro-64 3,4-dihydroxylase Tpa1-like proline 4-hydroxylase
MNLFRYSTRLVNVLPRIHDIVLQILRYEHGQHYSPHHDSSEDDNDLTCGPRILTFFLYFSDVEQGGENYLRFHRELIGWNQARQHSLL